MMSIAGTYACVFAFNSLSLGKQYPAKLAWLGIVQTVHSVLAFVMNEEANIVLSSNEEGPFQHVRVEYSDAIVLDSNSDDDGNKPSHVPKHEKLEKVEQLLTAMHITDPK